jgi:hypothetical protein
MERAIKSIAITQEQDKLNLWIGYLNLESSYGTTETLQAYQCRQELVEWRLGQWK